MEVGGGVASGWVGTPYSVSTRIKVSLEPAAEPIK
jgi:hypothetical protein